MNLKKVIIMFVCLISLILFIGCKAQRTIEENNDLSKIETEKQEQQRYKNKVVIDKKKPTKDKIIKNKGKNILPIRDISSMKLVKEIKIGWNLGNTLDATGNSGSLKSETSWGNPVTKKEIFKFIKKSGFNTVRIPVTWEGHLGPAPNYTIDAKWMARVKEVVDYSIDNDLYTIINFHHEEWHYPSYSNEDAAKKQLVKIWKQVAEEFKGYDEHLIFEGLNEPRMKGTSVEWNGNQEGYDVVNKLNAAFVKTIRKSGGNNKQRHLMIPTYAASVEEAAFKGFKLIKDDKIIVSVHAYTPFNFALNDKGTSSWSKKNANDKRDIDALMSRIDKYFISKGTPVIIGEFGARDKKGNLADRSKWAEYYIKAATKVGVPCIWWDNGAFSGNGEIFGILNRKKVKWQYPKIVKSLMNGLK